MNKPAVLVAAALVVGVVSLWVTHPGLNPPSDNGTAKDPWRYGMAEHLTGLGIHIGPSPESDIQASRENGKIRVQFRQEFLAKQEPSFLPTLGLAQPIEFLTEERYVELLNALHLTVADHDAHDMEEGRDHDHSSPQEGGSNP